MSKCGICDQWFLTGEKIVYFDGTTIHARCNSNGVDSNERVIGGGAVQTPMKAPKMTFEQHLTEFARIRYHSEDILEELSVRLKARFPMEDVFEANVKEVVRPNIINGLPEDKQKLIRMTRKKAISLGLEAERHNAMTKVLRILNTIRYHCYRGYPPAEDDDEDDEEGKKEVTDLNNVPVATAVTKDVVSVVARKVEEIGSDEEAEEEEEEEEDTQESENLSQDLSQLNLSKLQSHNLQENIYLFEISNIFEQTRV